MKKSLNFPKPRNKYLTHCQNQIRATLLFTKDEVRPTPQEIKDFSARLAFHEDLGIDTVPSASARPSSFAIGDVVSIQSGDLTNLRGKITSVDARNGTAEVEPVEQTARLVPSISVALNDIVKYFDVGASVRCVFGPSQGNAGLVTAFDLKKKTVTVFSPSLGGPFTCLLEDLTSGSDSGTGIGGVSRLGGYSVGDLVQLCASATTGVIVRIDPAKRLTVLTCEGKEEDVALSGIGKRGLVGGADYRARN